MVEPIRLAFETWLVLHPRRTKPVGPLPAELRPVDRAPVLEDLPQRAAARVACDRQLLAGIVQVVVGAVGVHRALVQRARARMEVAEAPQVEGPQVHLRVALHDPLGHGAPCPTRRGDAGGKPAGDEHVVALDRLSHDRLAVGRYRDRAVDELLQSRARRTPGCAPRWRARSPRSAPCSAAAAPARTRTARPRRGTRACPFPSRRPRSRRPPASSRSSGPDRAASAASRSSPSSARSPCTGARAPPRGCAHP